MEKEQTRTHEQMKVTEDDLAKVRAINNAIREKLEKEEERCGTEEESLKVRNVQIIISFPSKSSSFIYRLYNTRWYVRHSFES